MLTKEEIFEVLTDWNYWDRPLPATVIRQSYEEEIARKAASGEILILKGGKALRQIHPADQGISICKFVTYSSNR